MKETNTMSLTKRLPEAQESTPTRKLEHVRVSLRAVARNVQSTEGRLLDFETADEMQRTLHVSLSILEELAVEVIERSAL
jgi:hypothetical protein